MLRSLQQFFNRSVSVEKGEVGDSESRLRVATAALFVEMTRADFEVSRVEDEAVLRSIETTLGVAADQAGELLRLAKDESSDSVELFQFTRLVDREFTPEQKAEVIQRLWEVAMADSHIDKHEEHLVRKIANLLHVPHREFIAAKKRARGTDRGPR